MRSFAILATKNRTILSADGFAGTLILDDVPVSCSIIETPEPEFRKEEPENEFRVLVRIRAFSLNYRDKNRIFTMAMKGTENGFYVVGSEFVAEVLDVGPAVTGLVPGDRVIGNNSYPSSGWDGVAPGVPTNHASKEVQLFHQAKLIKVPASMPDEIAASFSIGAQTTYSMIRRLEMFDGANVLVTSGKSNTSLFAINALKNHNVNVYVTSTSRRFACELERRGVKQIFVVPPDCRNFVEHSEIAEMVKQSGGFHFVIDPYFDLHLSRVLDAMAIGGKYVTCGLYDQYLTLIQQPAPPTYGTGRELLTAMLKNLQITGNCIGLTSDLQKAIEDFETGALDVIVDSMFSGSQISEFLDRTYNSKDRFGKVVYQYV
jgi:NADPH:quinone reductase-like Zn-dependent oxidoreductase